MEKNTDFSVDLALAIQKLEFFTDLNSHNPSSLQQTLSIAFSSRLRKKEVEKQNSIQLEVFEAIKTIKKNYLLIQKLKKGNEVEQALAHSTLKVINRYNQTISTFSKKDLSLKERISNFIYKHCGFLKPHDLEKKTILLPLELSQDYDKSKSHEKINQAAVSFIHTEMITGHEADAFRAKAISLLQNSEMRFTSMSEEFKTIRSTPIQATIHSADLKRIMLTQILKPFPGETIAFKGEFQRHCESKKKSIPLRDSFEILTNCYQTGYPHPSQNTGWALSDCMLPPCPLRLELMPRFHEVFKLKQDQASELYPKGHLNPKAKEILKLKVRVFEENKVSLLAKHLKLNIAILKAVSQENVPENGIAIIESFFNNLLSNPNSYNYYTESQEAILQHYIVKPFEKLKEDFVDQKNSGLHSKNFKNRFLAALEILSQEKEKPENDYICLMGSLLKDSCNKMILQHMSETIGFLPPKLELHDIKIQVALYRQLISFQNELQREVPSKEQCLNHFIAEIDADIAIFKAKSVVELEGDAKDIVDELEKYYHDQFYAN